MGKGGNGNPTFLICHPQVADLSSDTATKPMFCIVICRRLLG